MHPVQPSTRQPSTRRVSSAQQQRFPSAPTGVGLGLRWDFLSEVIEHAQPLDVAFFEVSPENYMQRGGYYPAQLEKLQDRYPIISHGLTLSLGGTEAPPPEYLAELKTELERLKTPWHSDHICFSSAQARTFHDLLPLKFCKQNVERVADRARAAEDALGRPMALENISYYAHLGQPEMSEAEFIQRIIERSGAGLLLDVNNLYVNARNHGFDPIEYLQALPLDRVFQVHVAGHFREADGLLIDNHGSAVIQPVHELLAWVVERVGPLPVLLERDNDIPGLNALVSEVRELRATYERALAVFEKRHEHRT